MDRKNRKNRIVIFLLSGILFLGLALVSNSFLAVYDVTSVRIPAAMGPILGLIFGWPAVLGTVAANFISDLVSGYAVGRVLTGMIAQMVYGIFPYYIWKALFGMDSVRLRLDTPVKTIMFTLLVAVDAVVIGIFAGLYQFYFVGNELLTTAQFVFLNHYVVCMVMGLPAMELADHFYSKYIHKGKRRLSFNEKGNLYSSALLFILLVLVIFAVLYGNPGENREYLWSRIFSVSGTLITVAMVFSLLVMYLISWLKRRNARLRIIQKTGGTVFADEKGKLEFVSVPGGRLDFPVRFSESGEVLVDRSGEVLHPTFGEIWTLNLSCQKGCPMRCEFCDCPSLGYSGNVSREEFAFQVKNAIKASGSARTKKIYVNFSRMGEPVFNRELLSFIRNELKESVRECIKANDIRPGISTMMPKTCENLSEYLQDYCKILMEEYRGKGSLDFSIQATDEEQRKKIFRNLSLPLPEIAAIANELPVEPGEKYGLSFMVTEDVVIDASVIDGLFDKNKYQILLTPLHETFNAVDNGLGASQKIFAERFSTIAEEFLRLGWDVRLFPDAEAAEEEGIASGHLLLNRIDERLKKRPLGKKRIGLVVAIEMDAIFEHYRDYQELSAPAGYHLYIVEREGYTIYILQTGMGEAAAASGVQFLISQCKVSMIVNYGVVGGLTEDMGKHKVCIVERVVHYKFDVSEYLGTPPGQVDGHDSRYLYPNENLVRSARETVDSLIPVTCCSGDKFVGSAEEKNYLHEEFGGDICEMEAAGILLACELNRVPCMLLKAVSDGLTDGAEGFLKELLAASRYCLEVTDKVVEKIALTVE